MSMTFTTTAPRIESPCEWCEEARSGLRHGREWVQAALNGKWLEEGQVVPEDQMADVRCDPWCSGTTSESTAPQVNMSNCNATSVLRLLGLSADPCGEVTATTLLRRIMVASNTDRSSEVVEAYSLPGGHAGTQINDVDGMPTIQRMGAAVVSFGRDDDYLVRRLDDLRTLAEWSIDHSDGIISWG